MMINNYDDYEKKLDDKFESVALALNSLMIDKGHNTRYTLAATNFIGQLNLEYWLKETDEGYYKGITEPEIYIKLIESLLKVKKKLKSIALINKLIGENYISPLDIIYLQEFSVKLVDHIIDNLVSIDSYEFLYNVYNEETNETKTETLEIPNNLFKRKDEE